MGCFPALELCPQLSCFDHGSHSSQHGLHTGMATTDWTYVDCLQTARRWLLTLHQCRPLYVVIVSTVGADPLLRDWEAPSFRYASITTALRSDKRVVTRFRRCVNVIKCTYTNLDNTAYYTPRLHGTGYCS